MLSDERLSKADLKTIERIGFGDDARTRPDRLMEKASRVLSELSENVGIVVWPSLAENRLRHIRFVRLPDSRILVVLMSISNIVHDKVIRIDEQFSQDELDRTARYLNAEFGGKMASQFPLVEGDRAQLNAESTLLAAVGDLLRTEQREALEQPVAVASPVATGAALRARAEVLLSSGNAERAAGLALAGAEVERGAGAPIEAARSLIVAGRALVEAGERPRGLGRLERAEEELAACGAEGYRKQAIRELRRLGRRVAHRPGARTSGCLTPREWEIAQLVTDGRTNREIAVSLHLSVKTVDRHLSNILTKLDVPSRVAVAALVARDGTGLAS